MSVIRICKCENYTSRRSFYCPIMLPTNRASSWKLINVAAIWTIKFRFSENRASVLRTEVRGQNATRFNETVVKFYQFCELRVRQNYLHTGRHINSACRRFWYSWLDKTKALENPNTDIRHFLSCFLMWTDGKVDF